MKRNGKYLLYLKSARWQELRLQGLQLASYRCKSCNSSENLHVHHHKYPSVLGEEDTSFLTVLCKRCHKKEHKSLKKDNKKSKPEKHPPRFVSLLERTARLEIKRREKRQRKRAHRLELKNKKSELYSYLKEKQRVE